MVDLRQLWPPLPQLQRVALHALRAPAMRRALVVLLAGPLVMLVALGLALGNDALERGEARR